MSLSLTPPSVAPSEFPWSPIRSGSILTPLISAGGTYAAAGCPLTCTSFVQNYPTAFSEAYWSVNSLRVYTASGHPAKDVSPGALSSAALGGIAAGAVAGVLVALYLAWRYRSRRKAR